MNRLLRYLKNALTSRIFVWVFTMLLQIAWFIGLFVFFNSYFKYASLIIQVLSVILVILIVNNQENPSYKLIWSIVILTAPVLGFALYILLGRKSINKRNRIRYQGIHNMTSVDLNELRSEYDLSKDILTGYGKQSSYIERASGYPLYENQGITYYPSGESLFNPLLEDLRKAEKYIFIEFFIIMEGIFFDSIMEILEEKVKEGIDVRIIYDDLGSIKCLPSKFYETIREKGIKCYKFNRLLPFVSIVSNNRDHRKIIIIDGKIAYTGGFNLSDEYINEWERFGYWKDNGIRVVGDAVISFLAMFTEIWQYNTKENMDFKSFLPDQFVKSELPQKGYLQPFGESPLISESLALGIYLQMISNATKYLYITTPYLILDHETMSALCWLAKSGVDVRIIMPGIPDKKLINLLGKSYYGQLLMAGVKIYEYSPGFIHSKMILTDDIIAVVGTVNLDYRGLFLNFEDGVWMYDVNILKDIKNDFNQIFKDSREIDLSYALSMHPFQKTLQGFLRLIAPLL